MRQAYARAGREARVEPYLPRINEEYARCQIVVSRAGATTCAELAAAGRGAVLIPLELAGGHQRYNAEALAKAGAAEVIPEAELTGARLAGALGDLLREPRRYVEMGARARDSAHPRATAVITAPIFAWGAWAGAAWGTLKSLSLACLVHLLTRLRVFWRS